MTCNFEIVDLTALEILDSRGNPTVEAEVKVRCRGRIIRARADVPSGASTGSFEAVELRDGGKRYKGKGVLKAVENIEHTIKKHIVGMNVLEQAKIDKVLTELDGTPNKSNLGANATLAVSLAAAKAGARALGIPFYRYLGGVNSKLLPMPMMNIMNGGKHADNTVDFQEFMIMPLGAKTFSECVKMCCEVYHSLKEVLAEKGLSTAVGDEGGFAPDLSTAYKVIDNIIEAVERAGYKPGSDIALAMDAAASELYGKDGLYHFEGETKATGAEKEIVRTSDEMIKYYEDLCRKYPLVSIEDGLSEEDWPGWQKLTQSLGDKIQLVGDDLFVTNTKRIKNGIDLKAGNSVLIKVNQIGTLTEALDAIELARKNGMTAVISHRSGETEDTAIAHIALALNCGQIKTGAPARTDRTAKYNSLLRIEKELSLTARFYNPFNKELY